jgi:glycosyltransferase involved in cell wall biosynthesis
MKLSIILPYYKTFSLTKKLLEVLVPQLNEDTELIIINDGSDGQEFINYADVFINRKNNGGVTCARNDGIKVARGEYIVFIDCDDMIESDYISTLLNKINEKEFDLCWISWRSPYGDAIVNSTEQINIAPWGCIYHTPILKQIKFNEEYNLNEEPEFWKDIFSLGELKIDFISKIIYNYTIQENSLIRRFNRGEISERKE